MASQKCPINAGVPPGSILCPTLFLLYINDLPDDVICNIVIYGDVNGWVCSSRKSSFKMMWLTFSSKLDWGSYIISIPKTAPLEKIF